MRIVRDYEVSIWTLQDSFITVLKPYSIELKGQIQNPDLKIVDDGTIEFSFKIPMYYSLTGDFIMNPLWQNTINGNIVANLRKVKVIFNKHNKKEKVIELLIVKVTEKHEKDELFCEVNCEGLAFHELGKIGYRIALEGDEFSKYGNEKFEADDFEPTNAPLATLNYWNDLIFKDSDKKWKWNWTYEILMDHSNLGMAKNENTDKVYEDSYVSSWKIDSNSNLVPNAVNSIQEKSRLVNLKESNVYNLTQDLAKEFGVFCRYEYEHDDNYHITGRKVIYYNNFLMEKEGALSISYPYNAHTISRESDGTDLVTKLYVQSTDNNDNGELITIVNSEVNKTKEDYLLNFDYLWTVGAITREQYDGVKEFETEVRKINDVLIPMANKIISLENQLPELRAQLTTYTNSITQDKDRISAQDDLLNSLTDNTGVLTITQANPKIGIILEDTKENKKYINITEVGIDITTLKIYSVYNTVNKTLNDLLEGWFAADSDEVGSVKKIWLADNSIPVGSSRVYMTYTYSPELHYKKVKELWKRRMANDQLMHDNAENKITQINNDLADLETDYNTKLKEKEKLLANFERLMGPALREGYWQPEEYNDYGDQYYKTFSTDQSSSIVNTDNTDYGTNSTTTTIKFIYDQAPFADEQKNYVESFSQENGTKTYYPCIDLRKLDQSQRKILQDNYDKISLIFTDVANLQTGEESSITHLKYYTINSQCQYAIVKKGSSIIPVIMVTGAIDEGLTDATIEGMLGKTAKGNPHLGVINPVTAEITANTNIPLTTTFWLNVPSDYANYNFTEITMLYPRLEITSLNLRLDERELQLKYNKELLKQYEDYTVLPKNNSYFLTIKPKVFMRHFDSSGTNGWRKDGLIHYIVSNANTMIYLDAQQVLKENSFPKVSYDVSLNAANQNLIMNAYDLIGYIAHINDTDLKFENVYGYISEVDLKLDKPQDDQVQIKNYKTKFEDLFTTIVASTEQMQKNASFIASAASMISSTGNILPEIIQSSIKKVNLQEAFSKGSLTSTDNGLQAVSDSGVVAFSGGGIFTATQRDNDGNWVWNTGITPEGINADLITTGQLDTNRIKVYAGDQLKFQLNADGLFAYKSDSNTDKGIDIKQYVVHNSEGLFLVAKKDAVIQSRTLTKDINRVAISWDGLTLQNYNGVKVFYADADNGDLHIAGNFTATGGSFEGAVTATSFTIDDNAKTDFNNAVAATTAVTEITSTSVEVRYYAAAGDTQLTEQALSSSNITWYTTTTAATNGLTAPYYLYTRTVITYGNQQKSTSYSISKVAKKGDDGKYVSAITPLYYLKTTNFNSAVNAPSSEVTQTGDVVNSWTKTIPTYRETTVANQTSTYYRCEQYKWSDGTNSFTWSNAYADFGLTYSTKSATSASTLAQTVSQNVEPIVTNGIGGAGTWGSLEYGLVLGSTSTAKPLLIASNSGIIMAKTASSADGAAVVINKDGIALNGKGINLNAANNSTISLDGSGINLGTNGTITMAANNLNLTVSGTTDSQKLSDYIQSQANVNISDQRIWAGVTNYTSGSNTALTLTDNSINLNATANSVTSNFTINTSGLDLEYTTDDTTAASIKMNQLGIQVTGKKIEIDGRDVWSRGDIIYNPCKKITEFDHPASNWIWIQPQINSTDTIVCSDESIVESTRNSNNQYVATVRLNTRSDVTSAFSEAGDYYYKIDLQTARVGDSTRDNVTGIITLSNGEGRVVEETFTYAFHLKANFSSASTDSAISSNVNLLPSNTSIITLTLTCNFAFKMQKCKVTSTIKLNQDTPGTNTGIPCVVYYFP